MTESITVRDWYCGANRQERIGNALERDNLLALVALTPENAGYLAGRSNFLATHWRVPGIYTAVVSNRGERAVVSGDFGIDTSVELPFQSFPYTSWTESIDVRRVERGHVTERISGARPGGPIARPAQFDLDEVFDRIAEAITSVAPEPGKVGVDLVEVDATSVAKLSARLPDKVLVDATSVLDHLRAQKDPDEIAHLRLAGELTEIGIAGAVARLEPGMSEVALNSAYQLAVHERVLSETRFSQFRQAEGLASIGIGADSAHVIAPGETIKFDMQVDIAGYHSDIGRTFAIDPTPDQIAVYGALRDALFALQAAVCPGVTFAELHAVGTAAMHQAGFDNYSRGHLGHSVGLTQHFEEPPFIAPGEDKPLLADMMISIELPYYIHGIGSFQLERMVLVTDDGSEAIDRLPFELALDVNDFTS